MAYWYLPSAAYDDDGVVTIETPGLPDLSRALSQDHLREWVRKVLPGADPDLVTEKSLHFWNISHEIREEDWVLLQAPDGTGELGEVINPYYFEKTGDSMGRHCLRLRWHERHIGWPGRAKMERYAKAQHAFELQDKDALAAVQKLIPGAASGGGPLFRWGSMALLVSELIYFWPR